MFTSAWIISNVWLKIVSCSSCSERLVLLSIDLIIFLIYRSVVCFIKYQKMVNMSCFPKTQNDVLTSSFVHNLKTCSYYHRRKKPENIPFLKSWNQFFFLRFYFVSNQLRINFTVEYSMHHCSSNSKTAAEHFSSAVITNLFLLIIFSLSYLQIFLLTFLHTWTSQYSSTEPDQVSVAGNKDKTESWRWEKNHRP